MRRWFFLIAVLVLVLIALFAVGLLRSGGPLGEGRDGPLTIAHAETLDLRPADLAAAAGKGEAIPLTLGGERRLLQLHARNLVAPNCTVITLGEQPATAPCPTDLGTYAGAVSNTNDWSQARVSLTPQGVRGMVRIAGDTWVLEPVQDTAGLPAGTVRHIAYRTSDVSGRVSFEGTRDDARQPRRDGPAHSGWGTPQAMHQGDIDRGCDPEDRPCKPNETHPGSGTPQQPAPLPTLGIAFAADRQYVDGARFSPSPLQRQASTLNMVDGMYRREGVATFQIAAVLTDPTDRFFGSTNSTQLLDAIAPAFAAANLDITVQANRVAHGISTAFLTSGKPPDGSILGIARQPGITGMAFQNLNLVLDAATGSAQELANWMVMAHELGHNYNGMHEQADWFCRFYFIVCLNPAHTIMWPTYNFRSSPEFSRGYWDPSHNNRQTIRDHLRTRIP